MAKIKGNLKHDTRVGTDGNPSERPGEGRLKLRGEAVEIDDKYADDYLEPCGCVAAPEPEPQGATPAEHKQMYPGKKTPARKRKAKRK